MCNGKTWIFGWILLIGMRVMAGELQDAAGAGELEQVKALLLANPASINDRDREGKTALHYAAQRGHLEVVKFLLDNKADVNAAANNGATPGYLAKGFGKKEVALLLVERGGSTVYIKPVKPALPTRTLPAPGQAPSGMVPKPVVLPHLTVIPLFEAVKTNGAEQVKGLLAQTPEVLKERDDRQWGALHLAAELGACEVATVLLDAGMDPNEKSRTGMTPLHVACRSTNQQMIELLLTRKADLNAADVSGWTPFMRACALGDKEIVGKLMKAGANIQAKDKNKVTPLVIAASLYEQNGIAEMLVQAGADVNERDTTYGYTPVQYAVMRNNRPLLDMLLERKADLQVMSLDGENVLSLAMFEANQELTMRFRNLGVKMPPEPVLSAVAQSLVDSYRKLHATLSGGTFDDVRRMQMDAPPTREELAKVFLQKATEASELSERIKRNEIMAAGAASKTALDRQQFLEFLRAGARPGEYIRIEPMPASQVTQAAKARKYLSPDVPAHTLLVKRRGGDTKVVGDFFLVDKRWVMIPFVDRIFPELK
jgi:ankyrin repeat protein